MLLAVLLIVGCDSEQAAKTKPTKNEVKKADVPESTPFHNTAPFKLKGEELHKNGKMAALLQFGEQYGTNSMTIYDMSDDVLDACISWLNQQVKAPKQLKSMMKLAYEKDKFYDYVAHGYTYTIMPRSLGAEIEVLFNEIEAGDVKPSDEKIKEQMR